MPNDVDNLLEESNQLDVENPVDALLDEHFSSASDNIAQSLAVASKKNPDQQAKVADLAERTELPLEVVENQFEEVEARSKLPANEIDLLLKESPTAAERLTDPNFAALSHDDIDTLSRTEQEVRSQLSFSDKLKAAGHKGLAVVESSEIGMKIINAELGIGDPVSGADLNRLGEIARFMEFEDDSGFFAGIPVAAFEQLPIFAKVIEKAGTTAAITTAVGAAGGAISTKTPAGAAAGARFGFGLGMKAGSFGGAFEIEAGLAVKEYIDAGIDRRSAVEAAILVGTINGALEFVSLRLLGKTFAGAKPLIRRRIKAAIATETGRKIAKRIAQSYVAAVAGEGITEGSQEAVTMIGQIMAESFADDETEKEPLAATFEERSRQVAVSEVERVKVEAGVVSESDSLSLLDKAIEKIFSEEGLERIGESTLKGLQVQTGLGVPGVVVSAGVQATRTQNGSQQDQAKIDRVVELSNDSKLRERSPQTYHQLIRDIEDSTDEISDVYINAAEAKKWLDAEGINTEEAATNPAVETIIEQLPEALGAGGDVTVSMADFATYVAPSGSFESVRPHLKLRPDGLTLDELSDFDSTVQARIKKLMDDAQENVEVLRQAKEVYENVKDQLIDTATMKPENAAVAAEIIPAYVTTKAQRTGLSVSDIYQSMGLRIVGPEVELEGETLEQGDVVGREEIQASALSDVFDEREKLVTDREATTAETEAIDSFMERLSDSPGFDLENDALLERRLSELIFLGDLPRNAELRFEGQSVIQRGEKPATPKALSEQTRELAARREGLEAKRRTFDERDKKLSERVDRIFSGPPRTLKQDKRGEIQFDPDTQAATIRLTEAVDLSTFLHEAGHLFLHMEGRFFNDPEISEEAKVDGQAILDWLGVSDFDSITNEQHEKWAQGFEAYLFEGKAPSAELKPVFRRFAAWLRQIYQSLRGLDVKLTTEIRDVMDRMLATDEQIEEVKAGLALDPLFKTAEDMQVTDPEFTEYKRKTQGQAEEELRTKILAQLKRTTKKWWNEELDNVRQDVSAELEDRPLYRAIAFMRANEPTGPYVENKMDRRVVYEMLGLAVPKDVKTDPNAVDTSQDTLSIAIAKLGGLDRTEAEAQAQGVDPAHWRNVFVTKIRDGSPKRVSVPNADNLPVGIGKPLFRKERGRTFDEMRELLAELGYIEADSTESDLLNILLADLSGDTRYSNQVDLDKLFEDAENVTKEKLKAPGQLRGLTKHGGAQPDTIAAIFGFASGQELVRQIVESPTLNFAVDREANQVMIERHGDILNDGTLEAEAREAAHNTEQGAALLAELRALSGQTNVQAITEAKAIRDAAARIIAAKRISTLRPAQYRAAEVKAAKEAQAAKDTGNLEEAQAAKQKQLFNFHLWREATKARKAADTIQRRLRTMQTKKYRNTEAKPDYISRMKQLLAAYDFRRSNQQARQNSQFVLDSVKSWIREQQDDPNSPANIVDTSMLDKIVHYRDMTLDQLTAVRDVATSLLFAGRKNSQASNEVFKQQMKDLAQHIRDNGTTVDPLGIEDNIIRDGKKWGRAALAAHRKFESLVRQAEGFETLGPLWKRMVQPLLRANSAKLKMQNKAFEDLNALFSEHDGLFNPFHDKQTFELESGSKITLSLGGRISLALNWGNLGNREALLNMEHNKLSESDIEQILSSLSDFDWDLVQSIWDYIDTFWPQIRKLEKASTGVAPRKVEAAEYVTASGRTIKGGYYPLVADTTLGIRARQQEIDKRAERLRQGGSISAATQHGHTIERVGFAGKDVDLSITVLFRHVDNVIHDLSHREAVRDVDRVLRNQNVRRALGDAVGNEAYSTMVARVTEVAAGHIHPKELGAIERSLRYMRMALTYASLGFALKSGFSQTLGIATAIGEFGAQAVAKGFVDFYSNTFENEKFIMEHSVFMKDRVSTMNRDTAAILRSLRGVSVWNTIRENAFVFLLTGDLAISRPVWWMAYQQGMEQVGDPKSNFNTEQDAIDFADRAVSRTQQSGLLMDLAAVESKNEFVKMWTVMYSAFSAIYQIAVEQKKKYNLGKINAVQLAHNIAWILVIPALFEELVTGRNDDDDEDEGVINNRWTKAVAGFSLGTMAFLREVGWIMVSGQNSQLPIQKALSAPINLVTQVEQGLEEQEIDAALINSITTALSLAHIPGGSQINRSANYWLAYEEGDEEYFDVWEFLITGPREDE